MREQKMTKQISTGKCRFCNGTFTKVVMTKHLKSCKQRETAAGMPSDRRKPTSQDKKIFHIVVEGRYLPEYWMHLDVTANATLKDLDDFLRETWVECCGHLSAFTIDNVQYEQDTGGVDAMWPMIFGRRTPKRSMKADLVSVIRPGLKFHYEYDFGTTTDLTLKVLSEREGKIKDRSIQILARNDPPPITCEVCGKPATRVCSQCIDSGQGWLCNKCGRKHECGEEMLLPVVNSPRVGMCGYTG